MDTLELKARDLNVEIERARQQIEEKNAQGFQRQHSSADLDVVQGLYSRTLAEGFSELSELRRLPRSVRTREHACGCLLPGCSLPRAPFQQRPRVAQLPATRLDGR